MNLIVLGWNREKMLQCGDQSCDSSSADVQMLKFATIYYKSGDCQNR